MSSLRQSLVDLISGACDGTISLTKHQLKNLFKLGLLAIRQTKRIILSSENIRVIWEPTIWVELQQKMVNSERFKASPPLRSMCQQIVDMAKASSSEAQTGVSTKRKAEDAGGDEWGVKASKKAKRKKVKQDKIL